MHYANIVHETHEILVLAVGPFFNSRSRRFCPFVGNVIDSPTFDAVVGTFPGPLGGPPCAQPMPTLPTPSPETGLAPSSQEPIPSLPMILILFVFLPFAIAL